jgi:GNAT superfamily N-acetyltransferase
MDEIIIEGYLPGSIGRIVQLHGIYYSQAWGFDLFFEAKVAMELSEFLLRFNFKQDGFWTVCKKDRVEGSIAIDGIKASSEGAHLRWFILSQELRGLGLGHRLMEKALSFCRNKGYQCIYLWTFEGLYPARHIYEKFGFKMVWQAEGTQWGKKVTEQKFELKL